MGSIKVLDATGHTTMTADNSTAEQRRARWDQAIEQEHKVGFDTATKERVKAFDDTRDLLLVSPIAGG